MSAITPAWPISLPLFISLIFPTIFPYHSSSFRTLLCCSPKDQVMRLSLSRTKLLVGLLMNKLVSHFISMQLQITTIDRFIIAQTVLRMLWVLSGTLVRTSLTTRRGITLRVFLCLWQVKATLVRCWNASVLWSSFNVYNASVSTQPKPYR